MQKSPLLKEEIQELDNYIKSHSGSCDLVKQLMALVLELGYERELLNFLRSFNAAVV